MDNQGKQTELFQLLTALSASPDSSRYWVTVSLVAPYSVQNTPVCVNVEYWSAIPVPSDDVAIEVRVFRRIALNALLGVGSVFLNEGRKYVCITGI
jgi:hypothetical protein